MYQQQACHRLEHAADAGRFFQAPIERE